MNYDDLKNFPPFKILSISMIETTSQNLFVLNFIISENMAPGSSQQLDGNSSFRDDSSQFRFKNCLIDATQKNEKQNFSISGSLAMPLSKRSKIHFFPTNNYFSTGLF